MIVEAPPRPLRPRQTSHVARIAANMSALHHTLVSTDRETGMPYCRRAQLDGNPCPALHSLSAATDACPPEAAIRW